MSNRVAVSTLDKRRIAVFDQRNGTIHFWRRCMRVRISYSWGTDMEPLTSVACHMHNCEYCQIPMDRVPFTEGYCVGSYGGCARFARGTM